MFLEKSCKWQLMLRPTLVIMSPNKALPKVRIGIWILALGILRKKLDPSRTLKRSNSMKKIRPEL